MNNHYPTLSVLSSFAKPILAPTTIAPSPYSVWVDGTTLRLRAEKVQHENSVAFAEEDEIVTVLPPVDAPREGELHYRIWSDDTKPREGTIPFRIVGP